MEIFQGKSGFSGIALGQLKILKITEPETDTSGIIDPDTELKKLAKAKKKVLANLKDGYKAALHQQGPKQAASFENQTRLLNDHQFEDAIVGRILNQKCTASRAITGAGQYFSDVLYKMKDEYMKARSSDIKELTHKLLACVNGYEGADIYLEEPCIIAAKNLTSLEFLQIDKSKLLGLIVEEASANSHMAILAKAMEIPAILGCEVCDEWNGKTAIIDGAWRALYIDPDDAIIRDMNERREEEHNKSIQLQELKGRKCITKDGREIKIYGNISSSSEIFTLLQNDAEGIGLYRSEVLYMERDTAPTEDELFHEYKEIILGMEGKPVTIRTLDLGSNCKVEYLPLMKESNPALGCRGIRLCFKYPELFKTQLKALLRASVFGNLSVMYPMISSTKEIVMINDLLEEAKRELSMQGVMYKELRQGIMIETPAAVMISEEIADMTSFISIGTNDLTQYTLGVDRENSDLTDLCDYHHPAILKMIKMIVDNGHKHGIPVCICGELASDAKLTKHFLQLGVDVLSVTPTEILNLRQSIIKMDLGGKKNNDK